MEYDKFAAGAEESQTFCREKGFKNLGQDSLSPAFPHLFSIPRTLANAVGNIQHNHLDQRVGLQRLEQVFQLRKNFSRIPVYEKVIGAGPTLEFSHPDVTENIFKSRRTGIGNSLKHELSWLDLNILTVGRVNYLPIAFLEAF
jgi:hypothetical protein